MHHWSQKCEISLQNMSVPAYDTQNDISKSPLYYTQVTVHNSEFKSDKLNTQGNHTWVITASQNKLKKKTLAAGGQ